MTMTPTRSVQVSTPSDREIVLTRSFQAPRRLVFDAHTKPELIKRWLFGPDGWSMTVCEVDLRVGGRYRYEWKKNTGETMGMGGVHKEIVVPEKIVATELFDVDWTGGEALSTLELSEKDGTTFLKNTLVYSSKEARDGALQSGMTEGMEAGYARLDRLFQDAG